ncbi:MAG: hypothetical protein C4576_01545 [Desulfobacteraceae bacterium]|nr:MAG: hypothetical protein C4576_01545 [Desulfobacteraceae bacterium]
MRTIKSKKAVLMVLLVFIVSLALAMPALAQEKKKDKNDKVWGTLVSAKAEPSGKVAPVALETQKKEIVPLVNNGVAKKLEKLAGVKVEIEGQFKDLDGKKVLEPWVYVRKDSPDAPKKKSE